MLKESQGKVIQAAQKLQPQLSDSAERPGLLSGSVERPALTGSSDDGTDMQNDLAADQDRVLTNLIARQRKRTIERAAEIEEQRPLAKPKAAQRRKKRTALTTTDSVEQPVAKRKDQHLTAELFAAYAHDPSEPGAASSGSAVQPAQMQKQNQRMHRLLQEVNMLKDQAWVVGDAEAGLKGMISQAIDLQSFPAK